jgi:5-(carboxyamino)imidazole ribonucleotide synthase
MMALAARSMGYDVQTLDPDPACAMRPVASRTITAAFTDTAAAVELARACDVVTLEIEQIHSDVLDAVAAQTPMRPGREAVYIIQDRLRQKRWLSREGFPVGAFAAASSGDDIADAVTLFGASIAKSTHGGYDGRGQVRLADASGAHEAWTALGSRVCVVEQRVDIDHEISVLVARRPGGEIAVYPPSRNHHTGGILTWAVVPALVSGAIADQAGTVAAAIATRLDLVGLLAVEFFVTTDGTLMVNELAPRPHNTYHHSDRAFATSQFEQLVRAVCDLPLGSTDLVAPSAIVNLLGDVWVQATPPDIPAALEVPGVRLHLYGKASARAGRKMGHLSATGATSQQAVSRVLEGYRRMSPGTVSLFDVQEPLLPQRSS